MAYYSVVTVLAVVVLGMLTTRSTSSPSSQVPRDTQQQDGSVVLPHWVGTLPDPSKKGGGLPFLKPVEHITVYNSSTAGEGLYNHGPMLTIFQDMFVAVWYNGPKKEAHGNRIVISVSNDTRIWSPVSTLFPNVTAKGEENEPFFTNDGRLYALASDLTFNNSHGPGDSGRGATLMREIIAVTPQLKLGPIFWLANQQPPIVTEYHFPTVSELDDNTTKRDGFLLLRLQVNETVTGCCNERSLYSLPSNPNELILLLRQAGHSRKLWASRCRIKEAKHRMQVRSINRTWHSCKSGTGAYMFEQPERPGDNLDRNFRGRMLPQPINCDWSTPVATNIPDAPSRTCAAPLPDGSIAVIGNQDLPASRDTLTLITSKDGVSFDKHFVIRDDAPKPKFYGVPGFQYPSFLWCTKESVCDKAVFYAIYSISKEDISITRIPLDAILI